MIACLSLLLVTLHAPGDRPATEWFQLGVQSRGNAVQARTAFREAAHTWERGGAYLDTPHVAQARGRAYFLAGDTPRAIVSLHAGLSLAPYDAELQQDLAAIRETIRYPDPMDARGRVRPDPTTSLRHRVSPGDAFLASTLFGLVLVIGLVKRFTSRPPWAVALVAVGGLGFAAAAFVAWRISQSDEKPLVVLTAETILRKGNGPSYPARIAEPLPRGAELREIGRRGGWIQVEVAGGAVGWLEEAKALTSLPASGASPS